ncbi:hypothetical protein [Haloarchaeobius sp. DT45]|uniref:hypothetical protein n=1 Tax=Haloarchaeobius sp. DT45 TaxID=3446116 RepID=UPI003F6D2F37
MGPAELTEYVHRASDVVAASSELGLRNTQLRLVEPFLEVLGWNVRAPEVEAAYVVSETEVTVDYALLADGRPSVFVQTGACETSFGPEDRETLLEAMAVMDVAWGVLTNGRQFSFVGRRGGRDEWVDCTLSALPENTRVLDHYTRTSALERARARSRAERATAAERLDAAGEELVESLVADLQAATDGAAAADIEAATREFVDRLARSFRPDEGRDATSADGPTGDSPPEQQPPEETAAVQESKERGGSVSGPAGQEERRSDDGRPATEAGVETVTSASAADDGEYVARFFRDRTSVGAVGSSTVEGAMAQTVDYLIEHHRLTGSISLPYCPGDDDVAVLHREPTHPNGEPMRPAVKLDTGPFLWTAGDVESQRERLEDLASRAGLRVMFQGDWRPT